MLRPCRPHGCPWDKRMDFQAKALRQWRHQPEEASAIVVVEEQGSPTSATRQSVALTQRFAQRAQALPFRQRCQRRQMLLSLGPTQFADAMNLQRLLHRLGTQSRIRPAGLV